MPGLSVEEARGWGWTAAVRTIHDAVISHGSRISDGSRRYAEHHPDQRAISGGFFGLVGKGFDHAPEIASSGLIGTYLADWATLALWMLFAAKG